MNAPAANLFLTTKPKHSMLPLLTVLFVISYGLLAFLVVEQNRTLMNQRSTIQQLLGDSVELSALKGKVVGKHSRAASQPKAAPKAPPTSTPTGKAAESMKGRRQSSNLKRPEPLNPPKVAADKPDVRRSSVVI
jgi:hypothetical protein